MLRPGFTLVEAVVSTAIVTVAGSALLLGMASTIDSTDMVLEQAQADGMALQLMDEIAGRHYSEPGMGGHQAILGPESGETSGKSRINFDDLDDYHNLNISPPCDPWGIQLGRDDGAGGTRANSHRFVERFKGWRQHVDVFYASPDDFTRPLAVGQTSDYRVVWVSIYYDAKQKNPQLLSQIRRVFSYVPHN